MHPESDEDDHYILQGAFRFLTGREFEWDTFRRRRGQLVVGFMCDDSFGVETAKLVQRLVTGDEFDIIPLNKAQVADGYLRRVDAVLAPDGAAPPSRRLGFTPTTRGAQRRFSRAADVFSRGEARQRRRRSARAA